MSIGEQETYWWSFIIWGLIFELVLGNKIQSQWLTLNAMIRTASASLTMLVQAHRILCLQKYYLNYSHKKFQSLCRHKIADGRRN